MNKENLAFGTIIIAQRYQNQQEMLKIEKGHREGPFIVIGTKENRYICLEGSSPTKDKQFFYFTIPHVGKYALFKNTYFKLWSPYFIEKSAILYILDRLDEKDQEFLKKRFSLLKTNKSYCDNLSIPPLGTKDIIKVEENILFILSQEEKGYNCLHFSKQGNDFYTKHITINGIKFYFNPAKITTIKELTPQAKRINCVDDNQLQTINSLLKNYQEYECQKQKTTNGSLIKKGDNFYLIYGDYKTDWIAFRVDETSIHCPAIFIDKKKYFANFNKIIYISKREAIDVITLATESEMQEMRKKRKKYFFMNKPTPSKISKNSKEFYTFGDILSPYSDFTQKFVVITYQNKKVILVNKDSLNTKKYQLIADDENRYKKDFIRVGKLDKESLKTILKDIKGLANQYVNEKQVKKLLLELEKDGKNE